MKPSKQKLIEINYHWKDRIDFPRWRSEFHNLFDHNRYIPVYLMIFPIEGIGRQLFSDIFFQQPTASLETIIIYLHTDWLIFGLLLLVMILIAGNMYHRFFVPIEKMGQQVEQMLEGKFTFKNQLTQHDSVGELSRSLDRLADQLRDYHSLIERRDQRRKEFLSSVSHELRNPITVMRGALEALKDGLITSESKKEEYYRSLLYNTLFVQNMVNDLLEIGRLEISNFQIRRESVDLNEVLWDVIRSAEPIIEKKGIVLETENHWEEFFFLGDYDRLRRMLFNVIGNAIKFTPSKKKMIIRIGSDGQTAKIEIANEGSRITQEDMEYIFQKFYRSNLEFNKDGTGLGLPIALEIAKKHGIKLLVKSDVGQLTTFTFLLSASTTLKDNTNQQ